MSLPLVICAIFKNEALYLREWIEFHRIVGVDRFYLYNNNSTDNYQEVLAPYIAEGIVDLTEWPMPAPSQQPAYNDFIRRQNRACVWAAFIDCDEFLFPPVANNIKEVLDQIPHACAIGVNWMCFGAGDQKGYSPLPVIERFHHRPNEWRDINHHIKSIVRLDQAVEVVDFNPHYLMVENGTFNENGQRITSAFSPHVSRLLRINHYNTKSYEEWLIRRQNSKPDFAGAQGFIPGQEHFDSIAGCEVDDRTIQRFLPELRKRLNL